MVAVYQADIADLGACFYALGGSFYRQVLDGDNGIAVLQDIAVGVFYYEGVFGFFVGVPLMATFGASSS